MPIYEYRCENGHEFEAFQSMSEEPISKCMECGAPAQRVLSAPAVHFKGSGFYTTDYARKGKKASDGGSSSSDSASSDSKSSDSKDSGSKSSDASKSSSGSSSSGSSSASD
ncbi:MAG: FmdB family transcriptional regulator [Actinomycetota bacterium]|nr:FmdB family transcriptional regulator [Actinomycetota bacterium]